MIICLFDKGCRAIQLKTYKGFKKRQQFLCSPDVLSTLDRLGGNKIFDWESNIHYWRIDDLFKLENWNQWKLPLGWITNTIVEIYWNIDSSESGLVLINYWWEFSIIFRRVDKYNRIDDSFICTIIIFSPWYKSKTSGLIHALVFRKGQVTRSMFFCPQRSRLVVNPNESFLCVAESMSPMSEKMGITFCMLGPLHYNYTWIVHNTHNFQNKNQDNFLLKFSISKLQKLSIPIFASLEFYLNVPWKTAIVKLINQWAGGKHVCQSSD